MRFAAGVMCAFRLWVSAVISRRAIYSGVAFAVVVALAGITMYDWYYKNYLWPEDVQFRLFGEKMVSHSDLVNREGFSYFGQGAFTWRYRIYMPNPTIKALCSHQAADVCTWSKHASVTSTVSVDAVYTKGYLLLEEAWE